MAVVNKSERGRRKQTDSYIGISCLQETPSPRGDFQTEKQAVSTQRKDYMRKQVGAGRLEHVLAAADAKEQQLGLRQTETVCWGAPQ